jgi:hypothetical protein
MVVVLQKTDVVKIFLIIKVQWNRIIVGEKHKGVIWMQSCQLQKCFLYTQSFAGPMIEFHCSNLFIEKCLAHFLICHVSYLKRINVVLSVVYSWKAKKKSLLTDELAIVYKIHIERKNKANLAKQEDKERLQIDPTLDLQCSSNTIWGRISSVASNVRGGHNVPDNELE